MRKLCSALMLTVVLGGSSCADGSNGGDGGGGSAPASSEPSTSTSTSVVGTSSAPMPEPRTEVAGTAIDGRVVVLGGLGLDAGGSRRADAYDPTTDRWSRLPDLPVPLHHAGVTTFQDRVWVVGGYSNGPGEDWVPQAGVYSLGLDDEAWRTEAALGRPRGALAVAVAGARLVAMGGERDGEALATVEVLATGDAKWRGGPPLGEPREHLAAASRGGRVYAIAGRRSGAGNFGIVEVFEPAKPEQGWREVDGLNHTRGGIAAGTVDDRVCVVGGEEAAGTIASIECLDDDQWRDVAVLAVPRHGLAVAGVGADLFVIGGGPQPGLTVSDANERFRL